jgi:hypothetical protein
MSQFAVYSESSREHTYTIYHDLEDGRYFLLVDKQPYREHDRLFKGPFCDVLERLHDIRAAEGLKMFS